MNFELRRKLFIESLVNKTSGKLAYKEPDIASTYFYKNRKLPHIYLNDLANKESVHYLNDNNYSFNTDNLSLSENYKLVQQLVNRIVDELGSLVSDSPNLAKDYTQFCIIVNTKLNASSDFAKKNDLKKSLNILERILPKTIDYYNSIMAKDIELCTDL